MLLVAAMSRLRYLLPLLALSTSAAAEGMVGQVTQPTSTLNIPVVGGSVVPPGKWPDAVAVLGPQGSCTGTLIAPDVVLTAGHCAKINPTQVIANTTNYNASGGTRVAVKSITAYPSWDTTFDIAVVVLDRPITDVTPRNVGAGCTFQHFSSEMQVHLVGFGLTREDGTGSNTELREAMAPVLDPTCSDGNGCASGAAPAGEFVAGGGGTDSCFGDSGGPVYLDTPRGVVVIAAVSRGLDGSATPCGGGGIYVRTDKVLAWIEATVGHPVAKDSCADAAGEDPSGGAGGSGGVGNGEGFSGPAGGGCAAGGGGGGWLAIGAVLGTLLVTRRARR